MIKVLVTGRLSRRRRPATLAVLCLALAMATGCGRRPAAPSPPESGPIADPSHGGRRNAPEGPAARDGGTDVDDLDDAKARVVAALGREGDGDAGPCHAPLRDYCAKDCPTFEVARGRAFRRPESALPCRRGHAAYGACGGFRFVELAGSTNQTVEYFASNGRMVAATRDADYPAFCGGASNSVECGYVPNC